MKERGEEMQKLTWKCESCGASGSASQGKDLMATVQSAMIAHDRESPNCVTDPKLHLEIPGEVKRESLPSRKSKLHMCSRCGKHVSPERIKQLQKKAGRRFNLCDECVARNNKTND